MIIAKFTPISLSAISCSPSRTWIAYLVRAWMTVTFLGVMPDPSVDRKIISGSVNCPVRRYCQLCLLIRPQRIKLTCTILDSVAETIDDTPYIISAPLTTEPRMTSQRWRRMKAWEHSCRALAERMYPSQQMPYPPTGEKLSEAYWRTLIFGTNSEQKGCDPASPELGQTYKTWVSAFSTSYDVTKSLEEQAPGGTGQLDLEALYQSIRLVAQAEESYPFEAAFRDYSGGRKFCAIKKGYLGWVSVAARTGNTVCYFEANPLPFVIRRCEMQGYRLIGDCYLYGMMRGPPRGLPMKKIVLF